MTLPSSGSLSLSQVRGEHGGSLPLSMSQLLRGNASKLVHANNTAIPASAPLSLSTFRGTSRSGYYPIIVGVSGSSASDRQYGLNVNNATGTALYNSTYKGYQIGWFLWNEYDNVFGVSLAGTNIPQSTVIRFGTAKSGLMVPTGYTANFFGFSVWNVTYSSNPFATVGTQDNSPIIY